MSSLHSLSRSEYDLPHCLGPLVSQCGSPDLSWLHLLSRSKDNSPHYNSPPCLCHIFELVLLTIWQKSLKLWGCKIGTLLGTLVKKFWTCWTTFIHASFRSEASFCPKWHFSVLGLKGGTPITALSPVCPSTLKKSTPCKFWEGLF